MSLAHQTAISSKSARLDADQSTTAVRDVNVPSLKLLICRSRAFGRHFVIKVLFVNPWIVGRGFVVLVGSSRIPFALELEGCHGKSGRRNIRKLNAGPVLRKSKSAPTSQATALSGLYSWCSPPSIGFAETRYSFGMQLSADLQHCLSNRSVWNAVVRNSNADAPCCSGWSIV
jgi:hypothetical protein